LTISALGLALGLAATAAQANKPRPTPWVQAPPPRQAQQPAAAPRIEVLVLEATMGGGGIARELSHLPQLRQPPFAAYTQIGLLSRAVLALGAAATSTPLPHGGSAQVVSTGRNAEGRYTVDVRFTQGAQTSTIQFVASPGEPFFTVRSSRPDRALIVGFIVRS
jgi:hypothetical protein